MCAHVIWGSNTCVGKTLVSAGLMAAARRRACPALYLKPVQTGFPNDADGGLVARLSDRMVAHLPDAGHAVHIHGPHAREAAEIGGHMAPMGPADEAGEAAPFVCRTLFAWNAAVGPHLAVKHEGRPVADDTLVDASLEALSSRGKRLALVETAGGVASPAPSGTLQCDALLPLRLPALLVGDGALGGISSTLCASEVLSRRGIPLAGVVLIDGGLQNEEALGTHLHPVPVTVLPPLVRPPDSPEAGGEAAIAGWLESASAQFDGLLSQLLEQS